MYLRVATFVVEQDRVYQEVDKDDLKAIHVFKEDHDGEIIAYARIFPVGKDTVTFGRVVTSQRVRGKGVGKELLQEIMQAIKEHFPNKKIEIHAQVQVKGYYQQAGFTTEGMNLSLSPHRILRWFMTELNNTKKESFYN